MAKEKQNSIVKPGMLITDCSLVEQPQGSTRFVLNGVNETDEGDVGNVIREESNEQCYQLPANTIPLGEVNIGDNSKLLFLVDSSGNSYITLVDRECNLTTIVTDANQVKKFGFKVTNQIDAVYRLRRGCETVIYWIDPKPRIFILEKPELFQDDLGDWDIDKFNLFKTYSTIPIFDDIEVLDVGGVLPAGSYNFSVQYLDEDLNPTEFMATSEVVHIYHDSINSDYTEVRGSTSLQNEFQDFGLTSKAIKVTLSNLDTNFPFYKIAITESNSGSGIITATKLTAEISTNNPFFTYTGNNFESLITEAEVTVSKDVIEKATSIEQIENILVLSDTEGKDINYCNLQKYASKIGTDMITKEIILNQIVTDNPKHPTVKTDSIGFMPGEIYSLGIVYIFEDNSLSPVYHIPGKNPLVIPNKIYSIGDSVYPMNNITNVSEDTRYVDNNSCDSGNYWGEDIEGSPLTGSLVRHHRFPLRTDVNLPLVKKLTSNVDLTVLKRIRIHAEGSLVVPVLCPEQGEAGYDPDCVDEVILPFQVQVTYEINGITDSFIVEIDPADWGGTSPVDITVDMFSDILISENITIISIAELETTLASTITANVLVTDAPSPQGLTYTVSTVDSANETANDVYTSEIFGLKFSNIIMPDLADTNGNKVIGYYIVKNERTEDEKTILDSGVMTAMIKNKKFVSHGHLMPELEPDTVDTLIKKDVFALINPEFKFNNTKYNSFDIIQQGKFTREEAIHSRTKINDVIDGTSYRSGKHKHGERDRDGWSIQIKTRDNITAFQNSTLLNLPKAKLKEVIYLDALGDKLTTDSNNVAIDIFNVACDNKIGIISLTEEISTPIVNSVPYVYLYRKNANPYSNFRNTPYYKIVENPIYFGPGPSTSIVFGGDSYITPIRYTNSIFYDNRIKKRKAKGGALSFIVGGLLVLAGIAVIIFTGQVGVGGALISGGASLIASGIKKDAWQRAYNSLYKQGLRETIQDLYTDWDGNCSGPTIGGVNIGLYNDGCSGYKKNPQDDEIQWLGDSLNLWYESKVNMSLRIGSTTGIPDFLNPPSLGELGTTVPEYDREYFGIHSVGSGGNGPGDATSTDNSILPTTSLDTHMLNKLTYLDINRKSGRAYIGVALPELYIINPDYVRTNKQKVYNHLALEYDCCSECNEKFPHRVHYSLQSFQEELTDNFRIFLPNNYKDLEGNTGRITDMFRIQNKLYVHTEEALWELPQNFQERVTGEIISFIGTGEYFNIPARKVVDDEDSSAGNLHKWARIKTRYGVVFPCHKEKKIYYFSDRLKAISDIHNSNWFKENMKFKVAENYYNTNGVDYPYHDNPSNPLGIGYLSVYDTKKDRIIISKKDFVIEGLPTEAYTLCAEGDSPIIFTDMQAIIDEKEDEGWTYVGLEDCKMKFIKEETQEVTITTYENITSCEETPINPTCIYLKSVKYAEELSELVEGDEITVEYTNCGGDLIDMGTILVGQRLIIEDCIQIGSVVVGPEYINIEDFEVITDDEFEGCNKLTECTTETISTDQVITTSVVTYDYVEGLPLLEQEDVSIINNSWTMSFSLKADSWVGWHSYLPSFYMYVQEKFYSWKQGLNHIYRHGVKGSYGNFYGQSYPFIVEYVDVDNPLVTKIYDALKIQTEAKTWNPVLEEFRDERYITFNKILAYNTHQISGILNMIVKTDADTYIEDQITNDSTNIIVSRNERDWSINDLRDISINPSVPMFRKDLTNIQTQYYIDKIVNPNRIDYNKNWMELENFRDKFLVVRLIIDTFDTTRLIMNFSIQDSKQSER